MEVLIQKPFSLEFLRKGNYFCLLCLFISGQQVHSKIKYYKQNNEFYCFHDFDVRPEGETFSENTRNLEEMTEYFLKKQEQTGRKLLWGTANLFTHRR